MNHNIISTWNGNIVRQRHDYHDSLGLNALEIKLMYYACIASLSKIVNLLYEKIYFQQYIYIFNLDRISQVHV